MITDPRRGQRRLAVGIGAVAVAVTVVIVDHPAGVGAGHGTFTRGDVLVAHDGGIQWWSGGQKEGDIATPRRTNYGMAFDEASGGDLYVAYRQETWQSRHYRPDNTPQCVDTPADRKIREEPPTYTPSTVPTVTVPCQTRWTETSWVHRFGPSGQPLGELGGRPSAQCREPSPPGNNPPPGPICDDYLPQAVTAGKGGAIFVGAALGGIFKVTDDTRTLFEPPRHVVGASFLALSPDKCTAYYTSLDPAVHRFDVCLGVPLPDLVPTVPAPGQLVGHVYGVSVRPNGEVLVGSTNGVYRITPAGVVAQTYKVTGANRFYAVAVDPSDEFFWAASSDGKVHRIRFDNGTAAGAPLDTGVYVLGLAVKAGPPPDPKTTTDTTGGNTSSEPQVDVIASAARVEEADSGATEALFSVTLTGPAPGRVRVGYSTADGTASAADGDYVAASGTLEFAAHTDITKQVAVQINGDTTDEPDETFLFNLTAASSATIRNGQATATILNDDAPVTTPNDPATGPGGGGSSQQNQQTRPENTPPTGTTGGGGTSPTPVSANAPTPVNAPSPVATPSAVVVGSAAPTPAAVSSPVPMAGAVAGPAAAGVPGAPMTAQNPAPAGGELRPGRSGGGRTHEMVRHSASSDDETGMASATAGATLLFGCFTVGLVWASRRRELRRGSPAWSEGATRRPNDHPQPEQRERW